MAMFGIIGIVVLVGLIVGLVLGFAAGFLCAASGIETELQSGSIRMGECEYLVKAVVLHPEGSTAEGSKVREGPMGNLVTLPNPRKKRTTDSEILDSVLRDMEAQRVWNREWNRR